MRRRFASNQTNRSFPVGITRHKAQRASIPTYKALNCVPVESSLVGIPAAYMGHSDWQAIPIYNARNARFFPVGMTRHKAQRASIPTYKVLRDLPASKTPKLVVQRCGWTAEIALREP